MPTKTSAVGRYLAARLHEIGLRHYFAVPGDYNLVLLDELLTNQNLRMVSCANELNAGYAADGNARATGGAAAVAVTFRVGVLSALNDSRPLCGRSATGRSAPLPESRIGPAARCGAIGFLEHTLQTRFPVPKITSFVTPPFPAGLENQADSPTRRSKNTRIRASWPKFQKSTGRQPRLVVKGRYSGVLSRS
jgi:hypothetical protein